MSVIQLDTDVLASGDKAAIFEFAGEIVEALTAAVAGRVTYVASDGEVIAAVVPPQNAE